MIPGIPVIEGYTSILDSYKEQFSVRLDYKVTMEEPVIEVLPMGDWAMVRGVGNSTKIKNGVPLTRSYKWIILSRKQKDSSWKIVWDIFNYDHPINKNKNEEDAGFNKELVAVLDQIYFNDQSTRNTIGSWEEQYGRGSKEMNALWQEILKRDSINLIKVSKILEENGWPDKKVIGERGTSSLFLVIQHADQNTQEKYLPIIKKAMEDKNLPKRQYAMFYDRLLLRRGERQIYGTQLAIGKESKLPYVLPLEDPKNVDKRRVQMGLNTMQENLNRWKITWNVEEYIKSLPAIEAKEKELNIKNN